MFLTRDRLRRRPSASAWPTPGVRWAPPGALLRQSRGVMRGGAERKIREGDPIIGVLETTAREVAEAATASPNDRDVAALREWITTFLVFVRLFDRAVGLLPRLEPRELERALRLLGDVPDDTVLRLVRLLDGLPDDDVLELVEAVSRLSPTAAPPATKLMSGRVRTVGR